jgi:BlaI family penicillinase repressor
MQEENINLTTSEWNIMERLWDKSPRTGRETIDYMRSNVGWSRSTTLTMLRRMSEKGLISCDGSGEVLTYSPNVRREDAVQQETNSFIERVYKGNVGLMLSALTEKQQLSKAEIDELYDILRQAKGEEK